MHAQLQYQMLRIAVVALGLNIWLQGGSGLYAAVVVVLALA
jgi:hypothetical protein